MLSAACIASCALRTRRTAPSSQSRRQSARRAPPSSRRTIQPSSCAGRSAARAVVGSRASRARPSCAAGRASRAPAACSTMSCCCAASRGRS
eukprot:7088880-Prymnesium_polylepis.1